MNSEPSTLRRRQDEELAEELGLGFPSSAVHSMHWCAYSLDLMNGIGAVGTSAPKQPSFVHVPDSAVPRLSAVDAVASTTRKSAPSTVAWARTLQPVARNAISTSLFASLGALSGDLAASDVLAMPSSSSVRSSSLMTSAPSSLSSSSLVAVPVFSTSASASASLPSTASAGPAETGRQYKRSTAAMQRAHDDAERLTRERLAEEQNAKQRNTHQNDAARNRGTRSGGGASLSATSSSHTSGYLKIAEAEDSSSSRHRPRSKQQQQQPNHRHQSHKQDPFRQSSSSTRSQQDKGRAAGREDAHEFGAATRKDTTRSGSGGSKAGGAGLTQAETSGESRDKFRDAQRGVKRRREDEAYNGNSEALAAEDSATQRLAPHTGAYKVDIATAGGRADGSVAGELSVTETEDALTDATDGATETDAGGMTTDVAETFDVDMLEERAQRLARKGRYAISGDFDYDDDDDDEEGGQRGGRDPGVDWTGQTYESRIEEARLRRLHQRRGLHAGVDAELYGRRQTRSTSAAAAAAAVAVAVAVAGAGAGAAATTTTATTSTGAGKAGLRRSEDEAASSSGAGEEAGGDGAIEEGEVALDDLEDD